jgi:hypothetical protein
VGQRLVPALAIFSSQARGASPFLPESSSVSGAGSVLHGRAGSQSGPESSLLQFSKSLAGAPKESQLTMSSAKHKLRLAGAFAALATLALAVSCRGFFVNPTVSAITITPTNPTVPYGGTTQLTAFATFDDGSSGNVTGKVSWSSLNAAITVSSGGLLTGVVTPGASIDTSPVEIDALSSNGIKQTTNATVCVEGGSNFQISPVDQTVTGGLTVDYTASATATIQQIVTNNIDITSGAQWSSNNSATVTITSGTTPVTATTSTVTSSTTVLITASYTCNGVTNTFSTNLTVQ